MGATTGYGSTFDLEVTRKNAKNILATNRHHALILAGRLRYLANGYKAGTVLALNSVDGLLDAYDDAVAASGVDTAVGVLLVEMVDLSASENPLAPVVYGGELLEDKLVGLDANAKTDLKSRTIVAADGTNILKF